MPAVFSREDRKGAIADELEYITAMLIDCRDDRSPPTRQIFLLRTAEPYIWVRSGHRGELRERTLELTPAANSGRLI